MTPTLAVILYLAIGLAGAATWIAGLDSRTLRRRSTLRRAAVIVFGWPLLLLGAGVMAVVGALGR